MRWPLLVFAVACCIMSIPANADSVVFAGKESKISSPFVLVQDEILVPSSMFKSALGAKISVRGNAVSLSMPDDRCIDMTLEQTVATVQGQRITLPQPLQRIDKEIYLPLRSIMRTLSYEVNYDAHHRVASINPRLSVSYLIGENGVTVQVRSAAPLRFTNGTLSQPPRIYFDFTGSALGVALQQIPVNTGGLQRMRLAQSTSDTVQVRLTLDLSNARLLQAAQANTSDDGRTLTITFNNPGSTQVETIPAQPEPEPQPSTPPTAEPPPAQGPGLEEPIVPLDTPVAQTGVKISSVELSNFSDRYSELIFETNSRANLTASYSRKTRTLTLTIPDGLNELTPEMLTALHDKVVAKVECQSTAEQAGMTLIITLQTDLPYTYLPCESSIRVAIGTPDLKRAIIVLDPGHGGKDPGAVGRSGLTEKEVNLDIVLRANTLLKKTGATIYLTRDKDEYPTLPQRTALANNTGAHLFVSVHANASENRNVGGLETLYRSEQSFALANNIQTAIVAGLGLTCRKARQDVRNLHVLRVCNMPSALVEFGFLSNPAEEALLKTPEFRQRCAESLVAGITSFLLGNAKK